jgi:PilZ domain
MEKDITNLSDKPTGVSDPQQQQQAAGCRAECDPERDAVRDPERRAKRRAKTDLFVNRFLNGHPYLCRMTDISLSGARLVAINEPRITPPPAYMGLQFQLPGRREVITASGETVTCEDGRDGCTVGVRFTRLPATAVAAIQALLAAA